MIELDRMYIPALLLTMQKSSPDSREAISKLQMAWERFNTDHYRDHPDSSWRNALDQVGGLISRADGLLNTSDNIGAAHDALKKVRDILGALRKIHGIQILTDQLIDFQETMEAIVLIASDMPTDSLADSTVATLQSMVSGALELWQVVETLEIDTTLYGLTSTDLAELNLRIDTETVQLKELESALSTGAETALSKPEILERILLIKSLNARVYAFFGEAHELNE